MVTKEALVALEIEIVTSLEISLTFETVVPFIERYIIIAAIEGDVVGQVKYAAFQFCKFMQRITDFLDAKPSRQAASSFVLAVKMIESPIANKIGLQQSQCVSNHPDFKGKDPAAFWGPNMEKLTQVPCAEMLQTYSKLIKMLNKFLFQNLLTQEPSLWIGG